MKYSLWKNIQNKLILFIFSAQYLRIENLRYALHCTHRGKNATQNASSARHMQVFDGKEAWLFIFDYTSLFFP